jgi:hypothetical protein
MNTTSRTTSTESARLRTLSADVIRPRERTLETAQRLSLVAMRNWEKALTGVVALPAAAALTSGAAILFAVSLIERSFEMLESTIADVGRRVGEDFDAHGEPRERNNGSQPS